MTDEWAFCWLCALDRIVQRLDAKSCCVMHGLVKDRILGIVQVDVRFLERKGP